MYTTNILLVRVHHVSDLQWDWGITDVILAAPKPRAEREDDRNSLFVPEDTSASTPTTGTEETSLGMWKKHIRCTTTN